MVVVIGHRTEGGSDVTRDELMIAVTRFREARNRLIEAKEASYPQWYVVRVDNPRYHGIGIVSRQSECPEDRLPVLLSNGNIWWYELETITELVSDPAQWPTWIRETMAAREKRENARRTELLNVELREEA